MTTQVDIRHATEGYPKNLVVTQGNNRKVLVAGQGVSLYAHPGAGITVVEEGDEPKSEGKTKVFAFGHGDKVTVPVVKGGGRQAGTVQGRSDTADGRCDQYLVRHMNGHGEEVETWWPVDRLGT